MEVFLPKVRNPLMVEDAVEARTGSDFLVVADMSLQHVQVSQVLFRYHWQSKQVNATTGFLISKGLSFAGVVWLKRLFKVCASSPWFSTVLAVMMIMQHFISRFPAIGTEFFRWHLLRYYGTTSDQWHYCGFLQAKGENAFKNKITLEMKTQQGAGPAPMCPCVCFEKQTQMKMTIWKKKKE